MLINGVLNKVQACKKLNISRETLNEWLQRDELKRLLKPKVFELSEGPKTEFLDSVIDVWAKHLPPKNKKGGKRISKEVIEAIKADLT